MFAGENPFETGIALPTGNGKVGFTLRREIGEAIANDLLATTNDNKTYEITGSESYSYAEVASELSKLSGKTISYTDVNPDVYTDFIKQIVVPQQYIEMFSAFATDIKNNQHNKVTADLENLLGRKSITFSLKSRTRFSKKII